MNNPRRGVEPKPELRGRAHYNYNAIISNPIFSLLSSLFSLLSLLWNLVVRVSIDCAQNVWFGTEPTNLTSGSAVRSGLVGQQLRLHIDKMLEEKAGV